MSLENAFGALALDATLEARYGPGKIPVVATVVSSGDTTVHTPAAGMSIRLFWISAVPDETSSPLIRVSLGTTELYRAYALMHWGIFEGAPDEELVINLSTISTVAVTAHIQEF